MKIILQVETGAAVISIEDIIYCEVVNNSTKIITVSNIQSQQEFYSVYSLTKIKSLLPEKMFFLIHRSILINWKHFTGFNTPDNKVILAGRIEKVVAKKRKPKFKLEYDEYILKYNSEKMTFWNK